MTCAAAIERIEADGRELALILRVGFRRDGIEFLTSSDDSQQLGYMHRPAGYIIEPHLHLPAPREVSYTKEVLFVRSGRLRADFYDEQRNYLESVLLGAGDVVLLSRGGHGFEMLENSEIVEVKQGPYVGERDKVRFAPVAREHLRVRGDDR
jgi:mannose-6-phosphate isomerase-like protein (cupin superfamily)